VGLVGYRLQRGWRELIRPWVGAIMVLAIAGGAAAAAAGAARRTNTAYSSLLASHNAADAVVNFNSGNSGANSTLARIEALPEVVAHGRGGGSDMYRVAGGAIDPRTQTGLGLGTLLDTTAGTTISRLHIVHGRAPAPDRANEVVITETLAKNMGWRIGDRISDIRLYRVTHNDYDAASHSPLPDRGTSLGPLTVVGIGDIPEDILAPPSARESHIIFSPAFWAKFPDAAFYELGFLKLRDGEKSIPQLQRDIARIGLDVPDAMIVITPVRDAAARAERANRPIVNGLWLLAALAAAVGLLLAGQSIGRVLQTRLADHAQLRTFGATRAQRVGYELTGVVLALTIAGVLALLIGWAASPLAPVGSARIAVAHLGFHFDALAFVGALAVVIVVGLLVSIPGLARVSRSTAVPGPIPIEQAERRSVVADAVAASGLGAPAALGTRLALQPGRGRSATPVRSVLLSIALVVAATTATVSFGVNLDRLVSSPRLYGWNWDAAVGRTYGTLPDSGAHALAENLGGGVGLAGITLGDLTFDGNTYPAIGLQSIRGSVAPVLLSGSLPQRDDEIALGAKTLRTMNRSVGDTVAADVDGTRRELKIVGTVTMPAFGNAHFAEAGLGRGVIGTPALFPAKQILTVQPNPGTYNYVLVQLHKPASNADIERLRAIVGPACAEPSCVVADRVPDEIDGFRSARGLPLAVGVVLVLLLIATIAHVLLSTARRRTTDLAILRALGCSPRQLASVMRWQAGVLVGLGLAIGVPLGLAGGTIAWHAFTDQLGVPPDTVVPFALLGVLVAVTVGLSLLLASGAGVHVGRTARSYRFGA
jgi:hypothetical protein